ncbi:MAG: MBL fold metallo-hydrolase [Butyricicoccaceae bacterium]
MKIFNGLHRLEVSFEAAPNVSRSVFLYLIEGQECYLIDTGVFGAQTMICDYLSHLGKSKLSKIFLTHSHPDHVGAASELKRLTGCTIYASAEERPWIEDIQRQFRERPIPNFYALVRHPVMLDGTLSNDDVLTLEPGITLRVIGTPGHSQGSLSFLWEQRGILFSGDSIPAENDIPIFDDAVQSIRSLERLALLPDIHMVCPAWDPIYSGEEFQAILSERRRLIEQIRSCAEFTRHSRPDSTPAELFPLICRTLGRPELCRNPMFQRTILSILNAKRTDH